MRAERSLGAAEAEDAEVSEMRDDWALDGMTPRAQSVTCEWEFVDQPEIEGVVLQEIRSVPTSYGHLAEVWLV